MVLVWEEIVCSLMQNLDFSERPKFLFLLFQDQNFYFFWFLISNSLFGICLLNVVKELGDTCSRSDQCRLTFGEIPLVCRGPRLRVDLVDQGKKCVPQKGMHEDLFVSLGALSSKPHRAWWPLRAVFCFVFQVFVTKNVQAVTIVKHAWDSFASEKLPHLQSVVSKKVWKKTQN